MGNLIHLDNRRRINSKQDQHKGDGEVLIFTGVRYERLENTGSSATSQKAGKAPYRRKRKRS